MSREGLAQNLMLRVIIPNKKNDSLWVAQATTLDVQPQPPLPSEYKYPKFNTTLHTTISCPPSQPNILYETQYIE